MKWCPAHSFWGTHFPLQCWNIGSEDWNQSKYAVYWAEEVLKTPQEACIYWWLACTTFAVHSVFYNMVFTYTINYKWHWKFVLQNAFEFARSFNDWTKMILRNICYYLFWINTKWFCRDVHHFTFLCRGLSTSNLHICSLLLFKFFSQVHFIRSGILEPLRNIWKYSKSDTFCTQFLLQSFEL